VFQENQASAYVLLAVIPILFSCAQFSSTILPYEQEIKAQTSMPADESEMLRGNGSSFLSYSNPHYGFDISYPPNWTYSEYEISSNVTVHPIVDIVPPISDDPNLATNLQIGIEDLELVDFPNLEQYARNTVSAYQNSFSNFSIESVMTNSTISGMPAYEIVFKDTFDGLERKSIETGFIDKNDNKAYYLLFNTISAQYDQFYPSVRDVFDSFRLVSIDRIQGDISPLSNSTIVYWSPDSEFTFKYPSNWKTQESITLTSSKSSDLDMSPEIINIQTEMLPDNITLADYTESGINQLVLLQGQNFRILDSSPTTLAGLPAHTVTHTFTEDGIDKQLMQIWTVDNETNKAYVITYGSTVDEFNDGLSALRAVEGSFSLEKPAEGSQ
jgi:hypothetical protein